MPVNLSEIPRKMIATLMVILFILILGSFIYYRSTAAISFVLGSVLGIGSSIARVILIERSVNRIVAMDPKATASYIQLQYLLRMAVTAIALGTAVIFPTISLWGVMAGVLSFQVATYFVNTFLLKH